jgi:hypothetical protein
MLNNLLFKKIILFLTKTIDKILKEAKHKLNLVKEVLKYMISKSMHILVLKIYFIMTLVNKKVFISSIFLK